MDFNVTKTDNSLIEAIDNRINNKTKPLGSLGTLETIAKKICLIQNTLTPELKNPQIIVFAGDHGIAREGVSPYPQEVTFQMVMNFLYGGAAINVFTKQNKIGLKVVDTGVNYDFSENDQLINRKVAYGTKSFKNGPAMSKDEFEKAISIGSEMVVEAYNKGCNIIGFGEMGIGNTSSSATIMHKFTQIDLKHCVGRGTGLDDSGLNKKYEILKECIDNYNGDNDPKTILAYFGGFELIAICGAILKAAELKMIIMMDGFNVTASLIGAHAINENVLDYVLFTHKSDENGHGKMLDFFNAKSILDLGMRLGEGTGAAVAYPVIESSVKFLNEMASFKEAGVSNKG
ncbi:MAG: nicotinate-nucleotide--dimethylbenzimidazole phosphoribosyltransferase [Candidatus Delongbacteria bacterium]|nr:nicotinate-nucleotide--dimethylbenzimidazole phosphoribosyltransferase [Candidatus Delongbacteria bacterium]MBN2834841.1 nicotinate-nucleotide--dimethylbenzimidazole phosphoribosyltransferase [Candidatus Delongbacteria bacterium]